MEKKEFKSFFKNVGGGMKAASVTIPCASIRMAAGVRTIASIATQNPCWIFANYGTHFRRRLWK